MQTVILGARAIAVGDAELVVAGGMESMSGVPYYLEKARSGYRMGDGKIVDGMIYDGLWDPYSNVHMGACGDRCAAEYKFTREAQDEYVSARASAGPSRPRKRGCSTRRSSPVGVPQRKRRPGDGQDGRGAGQGAIRRSSRP